MMRRPSQGTLVLLVAGLLALGPGTAHAMHIAEGILPPLWALFWFALSAPFMLMGLRTLRLRSAQEPQYKALVGLMGAGVFVISAMPIPVFTAGTCSHPCGTGIAAILIGPSVTVVLASIALTLQTLFLAHGGLTTLGANILTMGVAGAFTGYGVFVVAKRLGAPWMVAAFLAGLLSDWITYGATSLILALGLHGDAALGTMFASIAVAFIPTQVPLGILEGFIAVGSYRFVLNRRPEFLGMLAKGGAL
jgi:cobalt/nickel transport system permease protein